MNLRVGSLAVSALFFSLTSFGATTPNPAWEAIEVNKTDEGRAQYLFGIPDYVRTDMQWTEYLEFQKSPAQLSGPCYFYIPLRASVPLLMGPLGDASSASACFESGFVTVVEWKYSYDKATRAHAAWLKDKTSELSLAGKLLMGSKKVKNGSLFISCVEGKTPRSCAGDVSVILKTKDGGN